ncbi:uncharacterized protein LOC141535928 isoform X2 [Cotesia typhae]|uniref:Histidine-rich glycoprotein n=1 Tax=Cotesia glomerata TaxID=32391 RepID=A0AAV7IIY1_COTGL|nr:hypothetical protein KQX54_002410 [Cotesia glomerata]
MKVLIVLFAVVAAVAAYPGWEHHHAHHVDAIHVPQPHPIPPLHPEPLKLKVHPHVTRIHYDHPKVHHPHLIGHEVQHHEPEIKFVKHEVHHEHHGHGWA